MDKQQQQRNDGTAAAETNMPSSATTSQQAIPPAQQRSSIDPPRQQPFNRALVGVGKDMDGRSFAVGAKGMMSMGIEGELVQSEKVKPKPYSSSRRPFRGSGSPSFPDLKKKKSDAQKPPSHTMRTRTDSRNGSSQPISFGGGQTPSSSEHHHHTGAHASTSSATKTRSNSTSQQLKPTFSGRSSGTYNTETSAGQSTLRAKTPSSRTDSEGDYRSIRSRTGRLFGKWFNTGRPDVPSLPDHFRTSTTSDGQDDSTSQSILASRQSDAERFTRKMSTPSTPPRETLKRDGETRPSGFPGGLLEVPSPPPKPRRRSSATSPTESPMAAGLPKPPIQRRNSSNKTTEGNGALSESGTTTDGSPVKNGPSISNTSLDSTPAKMDQWKRNMEGMLEGDSVEKDLASELGSSVRHMNLQESFGVAQQSKLPDSPLDSQSTSATSIFARDSPLGSHFKTSRRTSLTMSIRKSMERGIGARNAESLSSTPFPSGSDERDQLRPTSQQNIRSNVSSSGTSVNERNGAARGDLGPPIISSAITAFTTDRTSDTDASTVQGRDTPASDPKRISQSETIPATSPRPPTLELSLNHHSTTSNAQSIDSHLVLGPPIPADKADSAQLGNGTERVVDEQIEEEARTIARAAFEGDHSVIEKEKVAETLGGQQQRNQRALYHYMEHFDFKGLRVDDAFRQLCSKLYLKAESQEIDRILEVFSQRYFDCNPTTIFGSPAVLHTVTGSFLLLNTDLHVADISEHMSRQQFVRLTMETIKANMEKDGESLTTCSPGATTPLAGQTKSRPLSVIGPASASATPSTIGSTVLSRAELSTGGRETPLPTNLSRKGSSASLDRGSDRAYTKSHFASPGGGATTHLSVPFDQFKRMASSGHHSLSANSSSPWEGEMETALKEIYQAVKSSQILLPTAGGYGALGAAAPLSAFGKGAMVRAVSEGAFSDRFNTHKRNSVRGFSSSTPGLSLNSLDGRASPTPSHATSMEDRNRAYGHALGFASNLTHSVIKEHEDEASSIAESMSTDVTEDMSDDELALLGPPWAKEGILERKLYWESPGKRSRDKNWKQVFGVLQQGDLAMFSFGDTSGSGTASVPQGVTIGGGNWMANARGQGDMNLSHALASALPPPGYNSSRPHCFSLTLSNGEMSFFQAGTDDLVHEWVLTCNYWAARRSRPPLPGGVSNLDYGWRALEESNEHAGGEPDKADIQSVFSTRSGKSRRSMHPSLGGGKTHLADWKAPQPSLIPSDLDEETQLEALQAHVVHLAKDLNHHKGLETPLLNYHPPRSATLTKAKENWKNRSLYLLSEIVKYEVYTDTLKSSINLRLQKQGEKRLEKSLKHGHVDVEGDDDDDEASRVYSADVRVTPIGDRGEQGF